MEDKLGKREGWQVYQNKPLFSVTYREGGSFLKTSTCFKSGLPFSRQGSEKESLFFLSRQYSNLK